MAFFHVIIPAAGVGKRMVNVLPKQYIALCGMPMISHCIQIFFNHPRIAAIHVALNPEDDFWRSLTLEPESRLHLHYTGGATRAETVLNTLNAIEPALQGDDWILVHDAARPGLTNDLLSHLIGILEHDAVGGLLALPVADTLKQSLDNQKVAQTISRANLWQAQTPQMFRFLTLKNALSQFGDSVTDESEAIEALGLKPILVQGELRNLKITYPQDLVLLEALLNSEKSKGNA
ncbi:IspD 4-diphosphocytidyl-2-methyl-D-erithritol synthase [Methylophilaceae bacterium]|jgi:2-C-methyl-D-erythritol 4-phosphate cytidylyltransferase